MLIYQREAERLRKSESIVTENFSAFGPNKKREITRLIYEISKKEQIPPKEIFNSLINSGDDRPLRYNQLKNILLNKRFPLAYKNNELKNVYLPNINFEKQSIFEHSLGEFYPKKIYIERSAAKSAMAQRIKNSYPKAKVEIIENLKTYSKQQRSFSIKDFNNRRESLFLVKQLDDYFKKCPCTKDVVNCGYHVCNLGFGCIYDCTYCFLQEYTNISGIILPVNLDDYFDKFLKYKKSFLRLGTGEFTDSLMLDHITNFSSELSDFFAEYKDVLFELKTKSNNIQNLLKRNASRNIVISWSVNPQKFIEKNEIYTASLQERLSAAKKCSQAGYMLSFHFDPIVYYETWEKDYAHVVNMIFDEIPAKDIAWISLGTFRFKPELKPIIEKRFPGNTILDAELLPGFDSKLRYPEHIRTDIYRKMGQCIRKRSAKNTCLYLCMEEAGVWNQVEGLNLDFEKLL